MEIPRYSHINWWLSMPPVVTLLASPLEVGARWRGTWKVCLVSCIPPGWISRVHQPMDNSVIYGVLNFTVSTRSGLWWLLRTSVRKMSDFAFDFCIFPELGHSQMDDRGKESSWSFALLIGDIRVMSHVMRTTTAAFPFPPV